MSWSSRDAAGRRILGFVLAFAPVAAAGEVTPRIAVGGRVTAASNPFLLPGGESAVLAEGSIEPSLTITRADGSEFGLAGILTGRQYSRRYGNYILGSATATGLLRDSERLSLNGLASFERDIAADTITEDVGGAAGTRSVRNAIRGRVGATWRPNALDTLTPQLDFERVSFEGGTALLQTTTALTADLGYARRLSERTSLGARGVARRSRTAGEGEVTTLAAFFTGDRRLSAIWRLNFDIGAEHVRQSGALVPGIARNRTNFSGSTRLCAEGERLSGCANLALASEVSPLGGVQRRYTIGTNARWRLAEHYRLEADAEYSKAASGGQSAAPALGGALGRLRLAWEANRRLTVSGDIEYRRREFGTGPAADGVFAGVGLRWGTP